MTTWTREAVEALGPTTNVPTTASILGVDPDTVYGAIRRGEWTATRVLRIGRSIKVPVLDLIRLLYAPEVSVTASSSANGTEHLGCRAESHGAVLPLRVAP
jgi:hypothetical protein